MVRAPSMAAPAAPMVKRRIAPGPEPVTPLSAPSPSALSAATLGTTSAGSFGPTSGTTPLGAPGATSGAAGVTWGAGAASGTAFGAGAVGTGLGAAGLLGPAVTK